MSDHPLKDEQMRAMGAPWRPEVIESPDGEAGVFILTDSDHAIAQFDFRNDGTDWANARFACLAMNNHGALVDLVERLLCHTTTGDPIVDEARALLAKIETDKHQPR